MIKKAREDEVYDLTLKLMKTNQMVMWIAVENIIANMITTIKELEIKDITDEEKSDFGFLFDELFLIHSQVYKKDYLKIKKLRIENFDRNYKSALKLIEENFEQKDVKDDG